MSQSCMCAWPMAGMAAYKTKLLTCITTPLASYVGSVSKLSVQ